MGSGADVESRAMDEGLKDAIQRVVDRHYAENEGPASLSVRRICHHLAEREGVEEPWNAVAVACDDLVEEGRLVFLRDHGEDGRRYCSIDVPEATVEALREPMV